MVEKNMVTLTERTIMKSRSGVYSDTSENRRKHRVGQKYGAEKQPEDGGKTEKKETDPEKELEAVNKVIAAINEGKLTLPNDQIMVLVEKKSKLEAAKKQAEMDIKEAKKEEEKQEASGKAPEGVTQASYDSITKNAKATQRGYTLNIDGKDVRVERTIDTSGGKRTPAYQIQGMDKKYWDLDKMIEAYRKDNRASETDKEGLREARRKLSYLQDNEERLIKRDGKEKYDERLKQAKDEVAKLKGEKPKEEPKSEPKQGGEAEESYTRVKFDDVPNSGKVNLKKYLSDKMKKFADKALGILEKVETSNLKKMEQGLVKEFNEQFDDLPKSRRAEKLYSIMKIKGELSKRGK